MDEFHLRRESFEVVGDIQVDIEFAALRQALAAIPAKCIGKSGLVEHRWVQDDMRVVRISWVKSLN